MYILDRFPRHGHHVSDRIPPGGIVGRLLVLGWSVSILVDFNEHKLGGIVLLLDTVKPAVVWMPGQLSLGKAAAALAWGALSGNALLLYYV